MASEGHAFVRSADHKSERAVKNLGWLLRHWREVQSFEVGRPMPDSKPWPAGPDAVMVAHLRDGRSFRCGWASREICREWLHRPVFRGLPLKWFGAWICVC